MSWTRVYFFWLCLVWLGNCLFVEIFLLGNKEWEGRNFLTSTVSFFRKSFSLVLVVEWVKVTQSCPTLRPRGLSDQISRSVMSDSLRPHESQHARPPCPSPTPRVHSDSRPSSQWCHPAISSSVVPFFSCPQSLPAWVFSNESTLGMRWPKYWSFSFSIIPYKEIPGLISFIMDWLDLLGVQGTLKNLLQHHSSRASILWQERWLFLK